jgi:hypothetical protein
MKLLSIQTILFLSLILNVHAQRGRVQIHNGTLVTDKGTLLRGAFYNDKSQEGDMWATSPTKEDIAAVKEYGLNCIHIYHEDANQIDPGYWAPVLDSVVKWTEDLGLYLIILPGWWGGLESDFIYRFWDFYAPRYKDKTHVIYEIANEPGPNPPDYLSFDSSTLEMERKVYDTIRAHAPETHIMLMSPWKLYSEFVSDIKKLGSGIDWSNASIGAHGYWMTAQEMIPYMDSVQKAGYALTMNEYQSVDNRLANLSVMRVLEQKSISYSSHLSILRIADSPEVYKSRIESSEVRWVPDYGNWPENIIGITNKDPFQYFKAGYYDEGSGWQLEDIQTSVITSISNNDYIAYYYLDFENAPAFFETKCSSDHGRGRIEIHLDSIDGPVVGVCLVSNTGSLDTYEYFSCDITSTFTGVHKIFLVFKGTAPDWRGIFNVRSWYFNKSESLTLQMPYNNVASVIPGKIEAEEYDYGGSTISFLDMDTINHGSLFRDDEVDIDATEDGGYCVGWTEENEWLEYTVSCIRDTVMDIQLKVACWEPGNKINIKLNSKKLATVHLDSIGSYQDWSIVTIENILIPAGDNQILRLELMEGNINLDWLNFIAREPNGIDKVNKNKSNIFYPNPAQDFIKIKSTEAAQVEIYSMQGQLLIEKKVSSNDYLIRVSNLPSGSYIVKITNRTAVNSEILIYY